MSPRSRRQAPAPQEQSQPWPDPDLATLTKPELVAYAADRFGAVLDEATLKDELIFQVQSLIEAAGTEAEAAGPELSPEERLSPDGMGGNFIVTDGIVRNDSDPATEVPDGTEFYYPVRLHPNPDGGNFIITG